MPLKRMRREYNSANLDRVRGLRRAMTRAEKRLWYDGLIDDGTGFSFRKQHPFGPYVLDFYCAEARVCVELDGDSHIGREERDAKRDKALTDEAIRTLRFRNQQVFDALPFVLEEVAKLCRERCGAWGLPEPPPYPPPAPRCGEEQGEACGP